MSTAYCLLREALHYRRDAFITGLRAAGYAFSMDHDVRDPKPGDVLVIWNRYGSYETIADRCEAAGATVIVAENGYMGRDEAGGKMYALSKHGHNGSGFWNYGAEDRFAKFNIELKPWRLTGDHVLICPNRTFGMRGFKMQETFAVDAAHQVRNYTKRKVRIRHHPGNRGVQPTSGLGSLEYDLENAWAVVIWSSSAGIKALISGIPVFCMAPAWIAMDAAGRDLSQIENPRKPDRLSVFKSIAWAQWTLEEIRSGKAFRTLIGLEEAVV